MKIIYLLLIIRAMFCGCGKEIKKSGFERNKGRLKVSNAGRLDAPLSECSGIETTPGDTLVMHTDGGGAAALYLLNRNGEMLQEIPLPGTRNKDWEDITRDDAGNYYIGDFGNNLNKRTDLVIYKISSLSPLYADTIRFSYPDQEAFPPGKENLDFDCEAFFWHNDSLHLFSKNRSTRLVKHYSLPGEKGTYRATLSRNRIFLNGYVTAADVSDDKKLFALLAYGKIYVFKIEPGKDLFASPYICRRLVRGAQCEGLAFTGSAGLLISNENRRLFRIRYGHRFLQQSAKH